MRRLWLAVLILSLAAPIWAHEVVVQDETGKSLVVLQLRPQWSVAAGRDAVELKSPNDRTRIHCLELRSSSELEDGQVYMETMRDTLFQTYTQTARETTEVDGTPALWLSGQGNSRGFDTRLEALIFRTPDGHVCLVMMQQDVGYEGDADLKSMVSLP